MTETIIPEEGIVSYEAGTIERTSGDTHEGVIASGTGLGYYVLPPDPEIRWSDAYYQQYTGTEKEASVLAHLASGRSFGVWLWSEQDARTCLERIAALTDWNRTYRQLRSRKSWFERLQGQVSSAIMGSVRLYAIPEKVR